MNFPKRVLSMAAALTALSSIASGYYHFIYFPSRVGPFAPIHLQFDLSNAPNNTIYYFISDDGPNVLVPGDSFTAVVSELQLAAQAWNGVSSSQLKLAYGGLESLSTPQSAPGIDVVFDDQNIAAGILAQTKVTTYADVSFINGSTPFLPILRSRIQLRKNLTVTVPQQASFYDSSFTTMVHEFGHAIGLQHTLTSATMSTYITRSTTKAMPLAADDIAGVSLLYPAPGYLATTGSISGQVTAGGNGVNLASVVAISPTTGVAISALTNPDGTYTINAIPQGNYLLYVHPLPPAAPGESGPDAIVLPMDAGQRPFAANTGFVTQFFPGTRDWTQAVSIGVSAGNNVGNANFSVQSSSGPAVYGLELSGYVYNAVEASPMLPANGSFSMDFYAPGTVVSGNKLAPGLTVSVIGSQAPASVVPGYTKYYTQGYVSMAVYTYPVPATTPVALAVSVSNDVYVLPAAFYVVPSGPPTLTNLTANTANGTLNVSGSNLSAATTFLFDGTPVAATPNSDGSFTLTAPPAPAGYSASVEAMNPDGQTSGQAIPFGTPPQYVYPYMNPPTIAAVSPAVAAAGTDVKVRIDGDNTNFVNGQTVVGFGSSDIVVKQVYVVNPLLLFADISVNSAAPLATTNVTVFTGLQTATYAADLGTGTGMQIAVSSPNQISLRAPVTNAATGLAGTPAGGVAVININGIQTQDLTGWTLNIGPQQIVSPALVNGNQIQVTVPVSVPVGPADVVLTSPSGQSAPMIFMKVDAAPPLIVSVLNTAGAAIAPTQQVHPGDTVTLYLNNLSDGTTPVNLQTLFVTGGVMNTSSAFSIPVQQINGLSVQIQIPTWVPNGTLPVSVGVGTRVSPPVLLSIHN
ncbi:MAG TPA: matrixin family metalloprotease [Bryobacteraceae bacterium]|nr:matrixin family metalloprotease [Bryobacteraceae bacterium]